MKNIINTSYKLDNFLNKKIEVVKSILDSNGVQYVIVGDGDKVINQYPFKENYADGKVILVTNGNFNEIDLRGFSSKTVNFYCNMVGIECNITGNGYVESYNYEKDDKGNITKVNINLNQKYKDVIGDNTGV